MSAVNGTSNKPGAADSAIDDDAGGLPAMLLEFAAYHWRRLHRGRRADDFPPDWLIVAGSVAALVAAVVIVGSVVSLLLDGLRWVAGGITGGAAWLRDWSLVSTVIDPVPRWLAGHAAGLPVDARTLWWTWIAAGVLLWLLSITRSYAARAGWALFGASWAAMAWAATPGPARWTAAGLAALAWILLSLPAYRRGRTVVHAHLPDLHLLLQVVRAGRRAEQATSTGTAAFVKEMPNQS